MGAFELLIGEWHGEGEMVEPPMKLTVDSKIKRLGEFMVLTSVGEPKDVPDTISIIGGAPDRRDLGRRQEDRRQVRIAAWGRGPGATTDTFVAS